ncbi:hypothetical protein GE09DRAFT_376954 [Coniochaeta sp. 2T2.1]|nr:hypothetical protein GE09DRAFT_376954 [Coniochaeta sp. 2T2.1]
MNPLYVVLEVVQVLERQRPSFALGWLQLHNAHMFRVYPIEVVLHHSRSTVLESPLFVGQALIHDAARELGSLHQEWKRVRLGRLLLDHNIGGRFLPNAFTSDGLPLVTQDRHKLASLDAECKERSGVQTFRLVATGSRRARHAPGCAGRRSARRTPAPPPRCLSLKLPGRAVVEIILPVHPPDILGALCSLFCDQFPAYGFLLMFRADIRREFNLESGHTVYCHALQDNEPFVVIPHIAEEMTADTQAVATTSFVLDALSRCRCCLSCIQQRLAMNDQRKQGRRPQRLQESLNQAFGSLGCASSGTVQGWTVCFRGLRARRPPVAAVENVVGNELTRVSRSTVSTTSS